MCVVGGGLRGRDDLAPVGIGALCGIERVGAFRHDFELGTRGE